MTEEIPTADADADKASAREPAAALDGGDAHATPLDDLDTVAGLRRRNEELSQALQTFSSFQKRLQTIRNSRSIEEALDHMELLLDDAVEFIFAQLYLRDDDGEIQLARSMTPEGISVDWSLVSWACQYQEMAVIPVENEAEADAPYASILLLPLVGAGQTLGIQVLWVDFDAEAFTQEQSTLLSMLGNETASALESFRLRESIEAARSVLSDVVEAVPHGILATDGDAKVNLINSTMEFMLGVRRDAVLGRLYLDVLPRDAAGLFRKLIHGDHTEEAELSLNVSGVDELLGVTATDIQAGDERGCVILCRDLKLSREVTKLREVDGMKNDFLSLVSHELRTPLTSIMAYTETLLMEGMVDTEEERQEYLQIIYDEGERLTRLINDVLDLTKMEAGKMDYLYEDREINEVCQNSIMSSSSLAQQKGHELVQDYGENLPPARIDADRIMQVLMNLLSNAIKFTPDGGTITIRTRPADPFPGSSIGTVQVSVQDTGIGISPENIDKVFSKFEQIESVDHHSIGTGLGMPICRQIIEEGHGGKIWLESEVGSGTTFHFRIPIA